MPRNGWVLPVGTLGDYRFSVSAGILRVILTKTDLSTLESSMLSLRERGQGLAEYALILALIAILAIAALGFLSGAIRGVLSHVAAVI